MTMHTTARWLAALMMMLGGCSTTPVSQQAPALNEAAIVAACTRLIMDYAVYRDRADADAWANLFTSDGQMTINGIVTRGHAALHERIASSTPGPSFTHLMSTVQIYPMSADRARGISYVSVYVGEAGSTAHQQAKLIAVGEYRDLFERTPAGWKIAQREFVPRVTPAPGL